MPDPITHDLIVIGWRERLTLPALGLLAMKAKIDTGARTSALHVSSLEEIHRDGETWLRFAVDTLRHRAPPTVCEAKATDRRNVTDSGGNTATRWFIRTTVGLAGQLFDAEINLTDRGNMMFPMLVGRTAISGRFIVNPSQSYLHGRRRSRVEPAERT
ncbi:MAG: RimK/LysX family protein [Rudaea sp.]